MIAEPTKQSVTSQRLFEHSFLTRQQSIAALQIVSLQELDTLYNAGIENKKLHDRVETRLEVRASFRKNFPRLFRPPVQTGAPR